MSLRGVIFFGDMAVRGGRRRISMRVDVCSFVGPEARHGGRVEHSRNFWCKTERFDEDMSSPIYLKGITPDIK